MLRKYKGSRRLWYLDGIILVFLVLRTCFAEDKSREYKQGAYCSDIEMYDSTTSGLEGTFGCTVGGSQGGCFRHLTCIKEESGCQSNYMRAIFQPDGIVNQDLCEKYCQEIRPDLPVVSFRKSSTSSKICCACSSTGYPGQYCHSDVKCVIGASFCCEGNHGTRAFLSTGVSLLVLGLVGYLSI